MVRFITLPTRAEAHAAFVAAYQAGIPGWTADPQNDPLFYADNYHITQGFAIQEIVNRTVNSVVLGLAEGSDIDPLQPIPRLMGEVDADYNARVRERLERLSGFSNKRLRDLIMEGNPYGNERVSDVGRRIWTGNLNFEIPIQGYSADPTPKPNAAPTSGLQSAVETYMNSGTGSQGFIFATFDVRAPVRIEYEVSGTVTFDDETVTDLPTFRAQVAVALEEVLREVQTIDGGIYDSDLYDLMFGKIPSGLLDVAFTLTRTHWVDRNGVRRLLTPAAATLDNATLDPGGTITGIPVTDKGLGYVQTPRIKLTPETSGTRAELRVILRNGQVDEIVIDNAGSGYTGIVSAELVNPDDTPFGVPEKQGDMEGQQGVVYQGGIKTTDWVVESGDGAIREPATGVGSLPTPPPLTFAGFVLAQSYFAGVAIDELQLPVASAAIGTPTIIYTLDPAIPPPDGLTYNPATRTITGNPSTPFTKAEFVYRAEAAGYTAAELRFTIEVGTPALVFESSVGDLALSRGAFLSAHLPPATAPGTPTITYAVTGISTLTWLAFTANTRLLHGTAPPTAVASTLITYTATAPGYTTVTQTFRIEVA